MCKRLEVLSLPLPPNKPVAYYINIIASLPRLEEFQIYDRAAAAIDVTEPRIVELIKAVGKFPRLEIFGFRKSSAENSLRVYLHLPESLFMKGNLKT